MEVINTPKYNKCEERRRKEDGTLGYCDFCGHAIYSAGDAVVVEATDDIIHRDCWEEYSGEHMFDFVIEVEEADDFSYA